MMSEKESDVRSRPQMRREGVQLYAEIVSNTPERYLNGVVIYGTPDAVCDELARLRGRCRSNTSYVPRSVMSRSCSSPTRCCRVSVLAADHFLALPTTLGGPPYEGGLIAGRMIEKYYPVQRKDS
jgi:hypothetical protein